MQQEINLAADIKFKHLTYGTELYSSPKLYSIFSDIYSKMSAITNFVEIAYQDLVQLRDNNNLVPGRYYRIIDYIATTSKSGTISANHQFDVIVIAVSSNELLAEAAAAQHVGDSYFNGVDFSKWKLWYSLDNDTNRFDWAKADGKGVIYRMIDEFGNDCPYDFKSIKFYVALKGGTYCYTFDGGWNSTGDHRETDFSLDGSRNNIFNNKIAPYVVEVVKQASSTNDYSIQQKLNRIVFLGYYVEQNTFDENCADIILGQYSSSTAYVKYNKFGKNCQDITIGSLFIQNTIGDGTNNCSYTYTSTDQIADVIDQNCWCCNNIIGNSCYRISLRKGVSYNTIGQCCKYIWLAEESKFNKFGAGCEGIDLNTGCYANVFAPMYANGTVDEPLIIPSGTNGINFIKKLANDADLTTKLKLLGYTKIEFITSTGTQYINTHYVHDDTTKVDIKIQLNEVGPTSDWISFYGARYYKGDTERRFTMWCHKDKPQFGIENGTIRNDISSITIDTAAIYDIHLEKIGDCSISIDGGQKQIVNVGTAYGGAFDDGKYDYLLAMNQFNNNKWTPMFFTKANLYSCKIYSGTTLKRDFVPVLRDSDKKPGLFDLVHNKFYVNSNADSQTDFDYKY